MLIPLDARFAIGRHLSDHPKVSRQATGLLNGFDIAGMLLLFSVFKPVPDMEQFGVS
jgi:hypothetical protein